MESPNIFAQVTKIVGPRFTPVEGIEYITRLYIDTKNQCWL